MKDRKSEAVKLATLLLEVSVIYVLAAPPYVVNGSLPPVLPHLLAIMAGYGAACLVSGNAGMTASAGLALFVAWATGLPLVHSAVLGTWIGWRIKSLSERESGGKEWLAVLISIAYTLGVFMMILPGKAGHIVYTLLVFQFASAVLLRNARVLYRQPFRRKEQDRAFLQLSAGLLGMTALLIFIKPLIAWASGLAGKSLGNVFYNFLTGITGPVWGPLERFFLRLSQEDELEDKSGEGGAGEEMPIMEAAEGIQWGPAVLFAVLLLLGAAVLISIFRSRYMKEHNQPVFGTAEGFSDFPMDAMQTSGNSRTAEIRRNLVRREVFRLERRMRRAGFGRNPEESFPVWLGRLGLDPENRMLLDRLYARVRYAEEEIGTEEAELFRRIVRSIRPPASEESTGKNGK
ncbi:MULTISPECIES: hypothetical protein [Bhargavaea]|uniref:DUF4129 domain-containing protein n=1 Tax=Bhargavaea changchunensis TaxID=2134037 RepID=A0ABW2NAZ3_9BACL|nr:hypothetical protein [Bhargavaea sp. CC-171006]